MRPATLRIAAAVLWLLAALSCPAAESADRATVRWVNDGDTVLLADGRRVRYVGIDTPEIDHGRGRAEAFAVEAREANLRLVAGRKIRLAIDREPHDRYGRLLAYVYLPDGTMVNAEMLRLGLGVAYFKRPNVTLFPQLLAAQRDAMRAGRGLWRKGAPAGPPVTGNRRSRRFHLRSCPAASRIRPENRVFFQKKRDAFWDGYSPAGDCIPKQYR